MIATWCKRVFLIGATVTMASVLAVTAQQGGGSPPPQGGRPQEGGMQGGPGPGGRPKHPLELALDANADGVIDAGEIANAATALKRLDKNGDGKLTGDEYRPPRPPHREGEGPGAEGPAR